MQKKGFTLIELLVVISIIGLLSSVVLASLSGARDKGRIAAGLRFEQHTRSALGDKIIAMYDFDRTPCDTGMANIVSIPNTAGSQSMNLSTTIDNRFSCAFLISNDTPINKGKSFRFTRIDNPESYYLSSQQPAGFDFKNISIGFWIKVPPNQNMAVFPNPYISIETLEGFRLGTQFSSANIDMSIIQNIAGAAEDSILTVDGSLIYDGKWHYILFSLKENSSKVFVDGKLITSTQGYGLFPLNKNIYILAFGWMNSRTGSVFMDNLVFYGDAI